MTISGLLPRSQSMSLVDCSQQQQRTKRKLDDYASSPDNDDDGGDCLSLVRMKTDVPKAAVNYSSDQIHHHHELHYRVSGSRSASCSSHSPQSHSRLQFFVRMISDVKTLVFRADSRDTVESIHHRIHLITGIPMTEQRFVYRGKQLHWEQTLADCSIENDANLQLVGFLRSTVHPQAREAIDQIVYLIWQMCKGQSNSNSRSLIKQRLSEYFDTISKNDTDKAAGHLQVFISSHAPAALAVLYMSPNNKTCADDLIRQLITWINLMPQCMHYQCAPILLEICKLLRRLPHDDAMYNMCRTCLGNMVEHIKLERVSDDGGSTNHVVTLQDILAFVSELAAKLSHDMIDGGKSDTMTGPACPLLSDVLDFKNFLLPIRTLIKEEVVIRSCISVPCKEKDSKYDFSRYWEEIKFYLHAIFIDLLGKMDLCLKQMEVLLPAKNESLGIGCYQYLAILIELNSISKLYQGAEEKFWTALRDRKLSFCYLIIKYARRCDDHEWIFEHKEVTNFECRRHLAMMLLPELKDEYDELHEMLIERSQLLAESFEYIAHAETDTLRAGLFLEFKNEEATGPGVLREWFFLVCQAIFDPQNALFVACPNDRRRFFPNPASKVDILHLEYFKFAGRVIALALMHKVQIGIVFDRVLFLQLAGKNVSLEDIRDADPFLYNSCKKILEMDPEIVDRDALSLTFILEIDELGSRKVVELCPDGKNIAVNSKNRINYVDLLIQHRFVESVAEQVAHFAQGFNDIINSARLRKSFFQSLEPEDLDGMLHGSEKAISVEDWKAHTEYYGYKETDPQISWFWKTVGGMSADQRKVLLFFWTSLKYLPVEGFGGLASRLYIYKTNETHNRLPSSHTCFYQLCFPPYQSLKVMQDRLRIITQEHVGCSFGTC